MREREVLNPVRETEVGVVDGDPLLEVLDVGDCEFAGVWEGEDCLGLVVAGEVETRVAAAVGLAGFETEGESDDGFGGGAGGGFADVNG